MTAQQEQATVAIFTSIPNGKVLAAVCGVNGIMGKVLETSAGSFAVLDDTSEGATAKAGQAISMFVKTVPILAMERRDGQIIVTQWEAGASKGNLAPGFALDQAPGVIVSLMTGSQTIEQIAETHPDKVFDAHMGRLKAVRELRKLAKQARNQG